MTPPPPAFVGLAPAPLLRRVAVNPRRGRPPVCAKAAHPAGVETAVADWGLTPDFGRVLTLNVSPPLLRVPGMLSGEVCDRVVEAHAGERRGAEAELYLNARVNSEVEGGVGVSLEAAKLLEAWGVPRGVLAAADRSGYRTRVDTEGCAVFLEEVLPAVERVLGLGGRRAVFEEGPWVRPSVRTYVVRDVTVVHYREGEGVSPHVDGKDATVLVYLSGGQEDYGGATCFPEAGVRVLPRKGDALVYWSKEELLHYAERVAKGEKWIMQILVDFRVRADERDVDYATGQVFKG